MKRREFIASALAASGYVSAPAWGASKHLTLLEASSTSEFTIQGWIRPEGAVDWTWFSVESGAADFAEVAAEFSVPAHICDVRVIATPTSTAPAQQ